MGARMDAAQATARHGWPVVVLEPARAAAQAAAALAGGPVPMPADWVGWDPAAVPVRRPRLICRGCAAAFKSEAAQEEHWGHGKRSGHAGTWLPPLEA